MAAHDYYSLLDVSPSATVSDIHKAYWRKAARCHPDKGGSHEEMLQIVEAWKILSDSHKRSRYDQLITYRHENWHNRRSAGSVKNNRVHGRSQNSSFKSWAEFEAIYQKALHTFNQDLYDTGCEDVSAVSFSPIANSGMGHTGSNGMPPDQPDCSARPNRKSLVRQLVNSLLLIVVMLSLVLFYRSYSIVGRYVPLEHRDGYPVLIMDTATGTVYSVGGIGWQKQKGAI